MLCVFSIYKILRCASCVYFNESITLSKGLFVVLRQLDSLRGAFDMGIC